MIDIHTHVLPGLDDGARTLEESLAMLRALATCGVRVVVATPHVRSDYPTTPEMMQAALSRVRAAAMTDGLDVEVLPGAEVAFDALEGLGHEARAAFGLGGREDVLLLEAPYRGWPAEIEQSLSTLLCSGVTPVIAHPERYEPVFGDSAPLDPLLDAGAVLLLDVAALTGKYGRTPRRVAERLLEEGYYYAACSDAHAPDDVDDVREGIEALFAMVGDEEATFLLIDGPRAILEGRVEP